MDNWLITPPFVVESEGYYRITVTAFSTNTDENSFELCLLNSPDVETAAKTVVKDDWKLSQAYASNTSEKPVETYDFKFDGTGTYYVGLHNKTSLSNTTYATYYVSFINVEKTSFVPGVVENLKAVPAENYKNAIEVSWDNPTTSLTGDEITSDDYKIEIYLNDAETAAITVDGDKTSATVNVDAPGIYTVTVKTVSTDDDHGTAPNPPTVSTAWVGSHVVPVPYTTEFKENDPTMSIWEIVDGNNDGVTFRHFVNSYSNYMDFTTSAKEFKDYLLSPHMELAPGFYKATVEQTGSSYSPASPVLGVIKAGTFDVDNIDMLSSVEINLNAYSLTSDLIFEVKEEGAFQIVYGLDETFTSYYSSLKLNKLMVATTELLPGDVTDLVAKVDEDGENTVELSWTNPSVMFNSQIPMTAIDKVVILRGNEVIATVTEDLTPGAAASYTDTEVPAGPN
ncbi:MAG: hypothetical protein K2K47_08945, partial [Duncaniella sp.]|nr:hypothetical protein [Duncaniella sp.]